MFDKSKRKHDSHMLFKLKLILIAFMVGTLLASFFPMIWLAPPLFALTPFVYIGLSLLWIPILWRVLRRGIRDRVVKGLIIACLISSILMTFAFQHSISPNLGCNSSTPYICNITNMSNYGCGSGGFEVVIIGNLLIAQQRPWYSYTHFLCILF